MEIKNTSPFWSSVECIQTCIKARCGLGRHIPINFKLKMSMQDENRIWNQINSKISILKAEPPQIKYDFKAIG